MASQYQNEIRFFCRTHGIGFRVQPFTKILCEAGGHTLCNDFPHGEWYEFCCDCATFWPADLVDTDVVRPDCLVCERTTTHRYLCDSCQVISLQSSAVIKRRTHSIDKEAGIAPDCPGCGAQARQSVVPHDCAEVPTTFLTSRSVCPFCNEILRDSESTSGNVLELPLGIGEQSGLALPLRSSPEVDLTNRHGSSEHLSEATPNALADLSRSLRVPSHSDPTRPASKSRIAWLFPVGGILILLGMFLALGISLGRSHSANNNPDPRKKESPPIPEGMVYIPRGEFTMGSDSGDEYERPGHRVAVGPFFIDLHEVTCEEYEEFVKATGHRMPQNWRDGAYPSGAQRKPVTNVDWYDANSYATWAHKRLPTEEEWEFAARGEDGRKYPWGNEWKAGAANAGESSEGGLSEVGLHSAGKSQFGVVDMIGNAWEWTASDLVPYPGGELSNPPNGERKVMRGASWFKDNIPDWSATFRGFALPTGGKDYSKVGFRCAKDVAAAGEEK